MSLQCPPCCFKHYEEIRKSKKYRYIILRLDENAVVKLETIGPRDSDYLQFVEDLRSGGPGECRYGLFDLEYMHQYDCTGKPSKREKLVLLSWCPNGAKAKQKILYLSLMPQLVKHLVGLQHYKSVTDDDELTQEAIEQFLRASDKI